MSTTPGPAVDLRAWHMGDEEPTDQPPVVDAYHDRWWRTDDGWRSANLGFTDKSVPWWWLTAYRSPLREETTR